MCLLNCRDACQPCVVYHHHCHVVDYCLVNSLAPEACKESKSLYYLFFYSTRILLILYLLMIISILECRAKMFRNIFLSCSHSIPCIRSSYVHCIACSFFSSPSAVILFCSLLSACVYLNSTALLHQKPLTSLVAEIKKVNEYWSVGCELEKQVY